MYAQYWIALAVTGCATDKNIQQATSGDPNGGIVWKQLTDKQKVKDALLTANQHIYNLDENMEDLIKFREELDRLEFEEAEKEER